MIKELSELPAVGTLLSDPTVASLCETQPRTLVRQAVRNVIDRARQNHPLAKDPDWIGAVRQEVNRLGDPSLRKVINGTGVILHTNLGRAPIPKEWLATAVDLGSGYVNLEYDLATGRRGTRYAHCSEVLALATGAEDALVVNNNASAVVLALHTIAKGKEVIVSRGELVEIGGSFRMPDIMEASGARLKEVGTTNRTRRSDYEAAITAQTGLILKVHPSNFRIEGFTGSASIRELVDLGKEKGIPVAFDLGSGAFRPLPAEARAETQVHDMMDTGLDLLMLSGDKLLGGPQAGILLGKRKWIDQMRQDPWLRIFRVDKFTLSILEQTVRSSLTGAVPSIVERMLGRSPEQLRKQGEAIVARLTSRKTALSITLAPTLSAAGGGSLPEEEFSSVAVSFEGEEAQLDALEKNLRLGALPVIGRRQPGAFLLDLRTIFEEDIQALGDSCMRALEKFS